MELLLSAENEQHYSFANYLLYAISQTEICFQELCAIRGTDVRIGTEHNQSTALTRPRWQLNTSVLDMNYVFPINSGLKLCHQRK